ncbi:PAS domain-containing hybrid sensor histidine kinase/response regulator [Anaerosacchariphilus polymeriproducens]|uniref:Circadian input-output histidine kinase CikA n=1 Tax=Anaerosacchariphilus polymeriproducens TaxID=1812858 RepID=A0A371AVW8_9FIRM|nr:PAS domain S-box protein [Anaerosacchariphilus polymeriproducens]RDU23679.1 PAS domain S-box protein [Anaerosacchariphilus polymeriproducens]
MLKKNLLDKAFTAAALSCIGDGIITTDINGKITYLNRPAEEILDLKAEKVLGNDFEKVIIFLNAETKATIKNPIVNTISNDAVTGLEHNTIIITENGITKYVSATFSPVKNEDHSTIGVILVLRDITRLKTLEQGHINEKNNLRAIFSNTPVGMIMLDDNALITQINETALLYINKKEEQVYKNHFGDTFCCSNSYENRSGCGYGTKCYYCNLRKAIELSNQRGQGSNNIEFNKILIVDGERREFWFRASVTPILVSGKKNTIITLLDITDNKKKEMEIIKSRDYSINILDQIPSLVWKTDTKIVFNYVNNVWYDFTGVTLEESTGYGWTNLIHPDDLEHYINVRTHIMQTKKNFQLEFRLRRNDGEYRWCLAVGAPYNDLDGKYAGYIGSIYDINDRKVAEDEMKRYRQTIDNARDIIFFLGLDGKIIEANKAAMKAYGYTKEELYSMNIRNIRESWGYTEKQLEQANKDGIFFEVTHRRKDGSTFQVEVSSQGSNIGKQRIIFSIVRDITERKKIENKVLDNQIKYRSLFMNMKTGFAYYKLLYDDKHKPVNLKFIEVNEAFLKFFGLSDNNIVGKNHADLFPHSNKVLLDTIEKYEFRLFKGKNVQIDEFFSETYHKWFEIAIYSPKENEIVTIVTEITTTKETERKLIAAKDIAESANKAKSEFLANMSHEIRTPINGMVGMVDLTLLTQLTADQKDNLITAKACANSLLNIINDVLDFSKMEAGKVTIENINFNIKELIEEIVRSHSPRINEKGLELNYTFSSNIPQFLIGDPNRLHQVLNNFISNAIKFTERGSINISVKSKTALNDEIELKFTVSDTGIGISAEDNKKLFQSFSQLENSFSKKYGGSGLGLAISRNLIELMGGRIGVDSEKGKGSSFYFYLKFKLGYDIEQKVNQIPKITKSLKKLKILLVEDDLVNQKVIMKMLIEKGHVIETANNGLEAIELFEKNKYDIILMDIQMSKMNGIEAFKRIKEIENNINHTPVIALTAYALQGDKEKFLALGFNGYIAKPIQMSELYYTLERLTEFKDEHDISTPIDVLLAENSDVLFTDRTMHKPSDSFSQNLTVISEDIKIMDSAIKNDNFMIIENMAHNIKFLSNEIDAMDIKDTAFRIELAARRGNLEEISIYIEQMKSEIRIYKEYNM